MPEIKTREVVRGTIKTLDRSAVVGERMKNAYPGYTHTYFESLRRRNFLRR